MPSSVFDLLHSYLLPSSRPTSTVTATSVASFPPPITSSASTFHSPPAASHPSGSCSGSHPSGSHGLPISDLHRILTLFKNSIQQQSFIDSSSLSPLSSLSSPSSPSFFSSPPSSSSLYQDLLLLLFIHTHAMCPFSSNSSALLLWMKTRLSLVVHPNDLKILITYLKYFLPVLSELSSSFPPPPPDEIFQRFQRSDPLQFSQLSVLSKRAWCQQINEYLTERQIARDSQQKTKILFSYLCRALSCHRPLCPTTSSKAVSFWSTSFGLESESGSCVGTKTTTTPRPPSTLDQSQVQEKPKGRVWGAISITKVFPFADVASPSPEDEPLPQLS
jgi:hypothetical protein